LDKKKKFLTLSTKRSLCGYLFVLPFYIGFIFLVLSPILLYFYLSFCKLSVGDKGLSMKYIGFENFNTVLFEEIDFLPNVLSSFADLLVTGTSILIFSFFIAVILNQKFHGRAFVRAIFFLPVVIASGSAALSQSDALSMSAMSVITNVSNALGEEASTTTLSNILINMLGFSYGYEFLNIIGEILNKFYLIIMSSGVQILIFLAGLQSVSPSLYEASKIDGATGWENFWKITFPLVSPLILVNGVYTVIDFLSGTSNNVVKELFRYTETISKFGLSSAMGTIYFGLIFVVLGLIFAITSKFIVYQD